MDKLFISVPVKGLTDDMLDIIVNRLYSIATERWGTELEVILSIAEEENTPIGYLAESIRRLQFADYFIGVDMNGLKLFYENRIAEYYGIPCALVDIDELFGYMWRNYHENF